MAQAIHRYAHPLLAAQAEMARVLIVCLSGLALICAGRALPF